MSQNPLTVLVVDDYPDAADSAVDLLQFAGFRAFAALSSAEALDMAEQIEPDVVVLEPLMRDGGGWEVVAWLWGRGGQGPALLALTCDLVKCRAGGLSYVVLKGEDPQTLLAAVTRCTFLDS